ESKFKRFVEIGRVALFKSGPFPGKIAVIVEIIDHSRVSIIDGPTTGVPRQPYPYKHLTVTPLKLSALPRGGGTKPVRKEVEKEAIVHKWDNSGWAQKLAVQKRWALTDFGRCSVILGYLLASRES
ncbi:hypothetical protein K443DRAFT_117845, partial [Laccaria amethystina LaAM-08-1]